MSLQLENKHFLNGYDMWTTWGVTLQKGSLDDFLKLPKRKASIEHDWIDESGIDIDLSRVFVQARDIQIKCYIVAKTEAEFWTNYDRFLSELTRPGLLRLSIETLGRDYYVYYKDCVQYTKVSNFKNTDKLFCTFGLNLVEKNPVLKERTYLITEDGKFIIT